MKKTLIIMSCLTVVVALIIILLMKPPKEEDNTGGQGTYRVPTEGVTITPSPTVAAEPDTQNPLWWAEYKCSPDEILTAAEIEAQNNLLFGTADIKMQRPDKLPMLTLTELGNLIVSARFPSKEYLDGKKIEQADREKILKNRNVPAQETTTVVPQYGIVTANTAVRSFPTKSRLTASDGKNDSFQETGLNIGEPVLVLWTSLDGKWAYVCSYSYFGWVDKNAYGLCEKQVFDEYCAFYFDGAEMPSVQKQCGATLDRAAVTNNVQIVTVEGVDAHSTYIERWYIRMGTILPKAQKNPEVIDVGFRGFDGINDPVTLYVPRRDSDGNVVFVMGVVERAYAPVIGETVLSEKNIVELAGRLLNMPYSWGDEQETGMDCSSTLNAVYRCFGMFLPRNTSDQQNMPVDRKDISGLDSDAKKTYIMERSAGTLLYFPGHVMMYLGEHEGTLYVLHNSTSPLQNDGTSRDVYSCVIASLSLGPDGNTYLDRLTGTVNIVK